jgi:hypothetical protein
MVRKTRLYHRMRCIDHRLNFGDLKKQLHCQSLDLVCRDLHSHTCGFHPGSGRELR